MALLKSKFFHLWGWSFFWIALLPTIISFIFGAVFGWVHLATLLLHLLSLPGALILGTLHFIDEFGIAADLIGVLTTIGIWMSIIVVKLPKIS